MPSLKDMLAVKSVKGFEPTNPPAAPTVTSGMGQNPYRRCPLPPFSATPDTLRQFDESGKVPARRVIPLPIQTGIQTGAVTNVTKVTTTSGGGSSGGGSGGGGSTPTLVATSVSLNVPGLLAGQVFNATATVAKSFQLLLLTATNPVEVRLYGTSLAQTIDSSRVTDTAPSFEITQGLITDVVFDTAPYQWNWQNRIAANADNPQSKTIYFTVINPTNAGLGGTIVTVTFVALET